MSQQTATAEKAWLDAFHAGDRACMAALYEGQFDVVDRVVGGILSGFDRENVVHEVFFRLLSDDGLRREFQGGSLSSWLRVMARNLALDHVRSRRFEVPLVEHTQARHGALSIEDRLEQRTHVRLTLERFRSQGLPAKWEGVFVARFLEQQDQPTAARSLGMPRTTLAYQEHRIRKLLERFVLRREKT
ncbi:MAG TPA: RNA polymerase sigma factor [Polyangia bacterium]|nr:RNA polymerase sigma factor [Polyangia bacterium]